MPSRPQTNPEKRKGRGDQDLQFEDDSTWNATPAGSQLLRPTRSSGMKPKGKATGGNRLGTTGRRRTGAQGQAANAKGGQAKRRARPTAKRHLGGQPGDVAGTRGSNRGRGGGRFHRGTRPKPATRGSEGQRHSRSPQAQRRTKGMQGAGKPGGRGGADVRRSGPGKYGTGW